MKNNNDKKRVRGVVDRVSNGIVVILVPNPDDPDSTSEIYLAREKIKKKNLEEGDKVTVYI